MAISKLLDDLAIISKLGDNPGTDNGLTPEEFKAKFDEAALSIQKFLNDVVIEELNRIFGNDASAYLLKTGGTMAGDINMAGNKISGIADAASLNMAAVTLSAAGWADNSQTVEVSGITADTEKCAIITTAAAASLEAYLDCGIQCAAQGENSLTFTCSKVPTVDVGVNVLILTRGW